jgi:predicted nuclease with TOPRIM domain
MFGKKLLKGYLVEKDGTLLKEFVFNPKAEGTWDDVKAAISGKGDLAALGAFEVGRFAGTVVKGEKMHFIVVGRDVAEDDEVTFFREMLNSVEKTFDASMDARISSAKEAKEAAKAEQEKAKDAAAAVEAERGELVNETDELDKLREELENLRKETSKWQEELKDFESKVNDRHMQINERVTLLLEREQALVRNQKAFDAAMVAKRGLMRGMQENIGGLVGEYESGFG